MDFVSIIFFKDKFTSEDKKYIILKRMLDENNINVLFGQDYDYYENLNTWIKN